MRHAEYVNVFCFMYQSFLSSYSERESYLYIVFRVIASYSKFKSYPGVIAKLGQICE